MDEGEGKRDNRMDLDWENSSDLTAESRESLDSMLNELVEKEKEISYQRRVLQGRIDLLRSEMVRRGEASLSPEDLARVLMDETRGESSA